MTAEPQYRLRLFLSADLIGSTDYKVRKAEEKNHYWPKVFKSFYHDLPQRIKDAYATRDHALKEDYPRLWKLLGDEIVLCCRVQDRAHLLACMDAFLKALKNYQGTLSNEDGLQVKGTAWLAAFPGPNITIPLKPEDDDGDVYTSEETEARADREPDRFDFLGKGIDTGFRIGRHSTDEHCTVSVQLGWLLSDELEKNSFSHDLYFRGRESLKGVNRGIPYPILSVDTDTALPRRKLRQAEERLSGDGPAKAHDLRDFLQAFMGFAGIEPPYFAGEGDPPDSYVAHIEGWRKARQELAERDKYVDGQEAALIEGSGGIPRQVNEALEKTAEVIKAMDNENTDNADNGADA